MKLLVMIDIEKFICSLIHRSSGFCVIKVVDIIDALHHQGLDYKEGKITKITPKLKENEDEKMKKIISDILLVDNDEIKEILDSNDVLIQDVWAWVEKQDKQNLMNIDLLDELVIQLEETIGTSPHSRETIKDFFQKAVQKYMNCLKIANREIGSLVEENYRLKEKKDEQKPAEYEKPLLEKFKQAVYDCAWGKVTCKKEGETKEEYAERWAEQFLFMVRDWADDYIDFTIQQKLRNSYEKGNIDYISGIRKELLNIENNAENIVGLTESQWVAIRAAHRLLGECITKEQNPTWSEEDRDYYDAIIAKLEVTQEDAALTNNQMEFLKSLKERYTWKPTDAQIASLTIACDRNDRIGFDLTQLLRDLKKLKEE